MEVSLSFINWSSWCLFWIYNHGKKL